MEIVEIGNASEPKVAGLIVVQTGLRIIAVEVRIPALAGQNFLKSIVVRTISKPTCGGAATGVGSSPMFTSSQ